MSTMELGASKLELIQEILDIDSAEVLDKVRHAVGRALQQKSMPCCYTEEEMEQRATDALQRYEKGEFITQGEMMQRTQRWR